MDSGRFIVFEGPEGGGKTLQAAVLADWLRSLGHEVVQCREPGGTPLGERIRDVLLGRDDCAILPEAETLLLSAARAQLVRTVIRPALRAGAIVICDRFVASTLAYQGGGSGLPETPLREISRFATGGLEPDLVFLLDVPVEVGLRRRMNDPASVNRIDLAGRAFHERVREAFLRLASASPALWAVIEATGPVEQVANEIRETVLTRFADWKTRGQGNPPAGETTAATRVR